MQEKSAWNSNKMNILQTHLRRLPLRYAPSIDISPSILLVNTFVNSRAVIQGVSIRTGLDKPPVYMAIKLLWLKPDKYYVTRKGSRLPSAQSSITGLYSIRYSPLHILTLGNELQQNIIQAEASLLLEFYKAKARVRKQREVFEGRLVQILHS